MPEVEIGEWRVDFPFAPYPGQVEYMRRVAESLTLGWNAALESPTGTGKTLSLLCASLAWQKHYKMNALAGIALDTGPKTDKPIISLPTIYYAARTHSQLAQVVRELNRTGYRDVKMVMLGSRDQLCVHEELARVPSVGVKNQLCRAKVSKRTCQYYNNFEKATRGETQSFGLRGSDGAALDIEDLVRLGKRRKVCPFYASREGWEEAELVLLPYNYILDPRTRRSNKIKLHGSIVIFDEAHNLPAQCEESVSVELTSKQLGAAIHEVKTASAKLDEELEGLRSKMDEATVGFGAAADADEAPDLEPNKLLHFIAILQELETVLDKVDGGGELDSTPLKPRSHRGLDGREFDGAVLPRLLTAAGLDFALRDEIGDLIDKIGVYTTRKHGGAEASKGGALEAFSTFVSTVYPADEASHYKAGGLTNSFSVFLAKDEEGSKGSVKRAWKLSYWCWEAGLGMKLVAGKGMRSIVVTSGTLSPLNDFVRQMAIPFQGRLECEHVISGDQVWAGILSHAPNGAQLNSSFQFRKDVSVVDGAGETVLEVCSRVPEGVLVFFASYAQLTAWHSRWRDCGLLARLETVKRVLVEPRSKAEFTQAMTDFDDAVRNTKGGAVFLAVCRGKLSEGIDFSDKHGRAVVILGIPYPPLMDPRVCLKKAWLDRQLKGPISGQHWYQMEAVRAVNQALGRVIRHKDDFGAILLAETRFQGWDKARFPGWLRDKMRTYSKASEALESLESFFGQRRSLSRRNEAVASTRAAIDRSQGLFAPTSSSGASQGAAKAPVELAAVFQARPVQPLAPLPTKKRQRSPNKTLFQALDGGGKAEDSRGAVFLSPLPEAHRENSPPRARPALKRPKIKVVAERRSEPCASLSPSLGLSQALGPPTASSTQRSTAPSQPPSSQSSSPASSQPSSAKPKRPASKETKDLVAALKATLRPSELRRVFAALKAYKAQGPWRELAEVLRDTLLPERTSLFRDLGQFFRTDEETLDYLAMESSAL